MAKISLFEAGIYRFAGPGIIINGRHQKRYRPMLYATIAALRPLPRVALSSAMVTALYYTCWCLKALNPKVL
jgi:hypothetical protein